MRSIEEAVEERETGNRWAMPPCAPKEGADELDCDVYRMECENYRRRMEGKFALSYGIWRYKSEGRDCIDFGRKQGDEKGTTEKNGRKPSAVL